MHIFDGICSGNEVEVLCKTNSTAVRGFYRYIAKDDKFSFLRLDKILDSNNDSVYINIDDIVLVRKIPIEVKDE